MAKKECRQSFVKQIFTANFYCSEKYFSGKMLTQKIVRSREQKLKKKPIKLKPCILKDVNKCLRSKKRKPVDVFQRNVSLLSTQNHPLFSKQFLFYIMFFNPLSNCYSYLETCSIETLDILYTKLSKFKIGHVNVLFILFFLFKTWITNFNNINFSSCLRNSYF